MDLEVLQILKLRRVWLQLARLSVIPPQVRPARGGFFSQPSSQTQRPRGGGQAVYRSHNSIVEGAQDPKMEAWAGCA